MFFGVLLLSFVKLLHEIVNLFTNWILIHVFFVFYLFSNKHSQILVIIDAGNSKLELIQLGQLHLLRLFLRCWSVFEVFVSDSNSLCFYLAQFYFDFTHFSGSCHVFSHLLLILRFHYTIHNFLCILKLNSKVFRIARLRVVLINFF